MERERRGKEENLKHIFTLRPDMWNLYRECFLFIWLWWGLRGFYSVPSALSSQEGRADLIINQDTRSLRTTAPSQLRPIVLAWMSDWIRHHSQETVTSSKVISSHKSETPLSVLINWNILPTELCSAVRLEWHSWLCLQVGSRWGVILISLHL